MEPGLHRGGVLGVTWLAANVVTFTLAGITKGPSKDEKCVWKQFKSGSVALLGVAVP